MLVEVNRIVQRELLLRPLEERWLYGPAVAVALSDGFDDRARVNGLVDVKGHGRNFKRGVLFLARPNQLRIKVRVVIELLTGLYARDGVNVVVNLMSRERWVGFWCDQTYRRIVRALFARVLVPLNV